MATHLHGYIPAWLPICMSIHLNTLISTHLLANSVPPITRASTSALRHTYLNPQTCTQLCVSLHLQRASRSRPPGSTLLHLHCAFTYSDFKTSKRLHGDTSTEPPGLHASVPCQSYTCIASPEFHTSILRYLHAHSAPPMIHTSIPVLRHTYVQTVEVNKSIVPLLQWNAAPDVQILNSTLLPIHCASKL